MSSPAVSPVLARCGADLAGLIDPTGSLRAAGLLVVDQCIPDVDPRPGFYYVTCVREGGGWIRLAGPWGSHQQALDAVDDARRMACEIDPRAHWYSYGTARQETDFGPGVLERLGGAT